MTLPDKRREEEEEEEEEKVESIEEGDEVLGSTKKPPINIVGKVSDKVYVERSND